MGEDTVESVAVTGYEDVFDIEVDRTHNFIANGLVTHNTRWHEDDLLGRLLSPEYDGNPAQWEKVDFPAIAENDDVLGRSPGEPLLSPLIDESTEQALVRWEDLRVSVGSYAWAALYQQHPSPSKGAIFNADWWRYWTTDERKATHDEDGNLDPSGRVVYIDPGAVTGGRWLDSWDCAFKGTDDSDFVVGQRWLQSGANRYLVYQSRKRRSFTSTLTEMKRWCDPRGDVPYSPRVHERLVEDKANGTAVIDTLKHEISGMIPINPTDSKTARARAITPECESGHVLLPLPSDPGNEWVADLLSELREFPSGAHDDQVDGLTQALSRMRETHAGSIMVPGHHGRVSGLTRGQVALQQQRSWRTEGIRRTRR